MGDMCTVIEDPQEVGVIYQCSAAEKASVTHTYQQVHCLMGDMCTGIEDPQEVGVLL